MRQMNFRSNHKLGSLQSKISTHVFEAFEQIFFYLIKKPEKRGIWIIEITCRKGVKNSKFI